MLAATDIRLTEETAHDLRAQGQQDRAAAIEAVLAVATAAAASDITEESTGYWSVRRAARATGQSARLIRKLIASGTLPAVIRGGETLVRPAALWACLNALAAAAQPTEAPHRRDLAAAQRRRSFVEAGLPADKWARLEHLHEQLEDGQRLSRAERAELVTLERELTALAGERLEAWTRRSSAPPA